MDTNRYSLDDNPTVFGKILRKEIPADIVYEDERILAFRDINPQTKVHILVIPKEHMTCLRCAETADADLLSYMMLKTQDIAREQGILDAGYRVLTNAGESAGQSVPHLHLHILGGEQLGPNLSGK